MLLVKKSWSVIWCKVGLFFGACVQMSVINTWASGEIGLLGGNS